MVGFGISGVELLCSAVRSTDVLTYRIAVCQINLSNLNGALDILKPVQFWVYYCTIVLFVEIKISPESN